MMEWFKAGGFGMFVILLGAGGIGYGIKALLSPSGGRAATLRSFRRLNPLGGALLLRDRSLGGEYSRVRRCVPQGHERRGGSRRASSRCSG